MLLFRTPLLHFRKPSASMTTGYLCNSAVHMESGSVKKIHLVKFEKLDNTEPPIQTFMRGTVLTSHLSLGISSLMTDLASTHCRPQKHKFLNIVG